MATLGNVIDPNKQTNLRSELAQGANVGDMARDAAGNLYRFSGVGWDKEGGGGVSGSSSSGVNMDDIINQAITRYQDANKPAIQSLEAGIPETQSKYSQLRTQQQARIDPLKARYDNLISQVKDYYTGQEQQQTKVTSAEMAKRGILGSSTLAQQEITNAVRPITSEAAYKTTDLGYQREDAIKEIENYIANLTPQETEELRLARNAIAQLQSGAATQGVSTGVDIYKQKVAEQEAARKVEQERLDRELSEKLTSQYLNALGIGNSSNSSATLNNNPANTNNPVGNNNTNNNAARMAADIVNNNLSITKTNTKKLSVPKTLNVSNLSLGKDYTKNIKKLLNINNSGIGSFY